MDKQKLLALIALLYAQEINVRAGMVKEVAAENNIKEGDLYKLLKGVGYEAKAPQGTTAPVLPDPASGENKDGANNQASPNNINNAKKTAIVLRHKTEYPKYRRAGLVLTQKAETYEVTEEQLTALKKDPWVVVGDGKKDGAEK